MKEKNGYIVNLGFIDNEESTLKHFIVSQEEGNPFDFALSNISLDRRGKEYYQLGDIQVATREVGTKKWDRWDTRENSGNNTIKIDRNWVEKNGEVTFNFSLKNKSTRSIEVGGLGVAMIFNQVFIDKTLDESHTQCVFIDPYIGMDAGYLQLLRLNGEAPILLVLANKNTPFEAYRPLKDDPTPRGVDFEGFYEWTIHSKAYAETDWKGKYHWNDPSSVILKPNDERNYSLKFKLTDSIPKINRTLQESDKPVVEQFPGYVFRGDEEHKLFITYQHSVQSLKFEPDNSVIVKEHKQSGKGFEEVILKGNHYGYSRLTLTYKDGTKQTVHYYVTESEKEIVDKLSEFHEKRQWIDFSDNFGRRHSYMSFDWEADKMVLEEERTFISGLSDEPGAGPNLLMAIKNFFSPKKNQVYQLEDYVEDVLWGNLQNEDYSINASLYYKEDENSRSWSKERGLETWRAYNYPHQAAIYWVLYKLSRNYEGLVTKRRWEWYLKQSYKTILAMEEFCGEDKFLHLEQFGLMVGSVHKWIVEDLYNEGWIDEHQKLEEYMYKRYKIWASLKYPYGSEMPWDSTGQEEVYIWCDYFNNKEKADQTVHAILSYLPSIPHWGYNGAGRRYFDSFVYGKWEVISREFHHYGSSLNAIPVLDKFKKNPTIENIHLLKAGYAGSTGVLCNVNSRGVGSMAYLADPEIMEFEPYTSDYGQAFYGYAHDAGMYVVYDEEKGYLVFSGEIKENESEMSFIPTDAFNKRLYYGPNKLSIEFETGKIKEILLKEGGLSIHLVPEAQMKQYRFKVSGSKELKNVSKTRGYYHTNKEVETIFIPFK